MSENENYRTYEWLRRSPSLVHMLVLRRSSSNSPSKNKPPDAAAHFCVNKHVSAPSRHASKQPKAQVLSQSMHRYPPPPARRHLDLDFNQIRNSNNKDWRRPAIRIDRDIKTTSARSLWLRSHVVLMIRGPNTGATIVTTHCI